MHPRHRSTIAGTALAAMLLMANVAVRAGQTAPGPQAAAPAPEGPATGGALYVNMGCETCHGTEGRGTAAGPALAGSARPLSGFIAYVRKPTGVMPPRDANVVSDQALAEIYAFLQPLRADAATGAPTGRVEAGAELYRKSGCYQCHSNEGQGGAQGPRLGPDPIPLARFVQYVRNPPGSMPPYTDRVISDQELADVHAFLAARPRPPAVSSIPLLAP